MLGKLLKKWTRKNPGSDSGEDHCRQTWLVAGLGNPGKKYEATRHNVGFLILDAWAKSADVAFKENKQWKCLVAEIRKDQKRIILLKPLTYMNASGQALQKAVSWYKAEPSKIMVILDDIALDTGKIRFRGKGSSGGHNGLQSVIDCLGTGEFARGRVGVGAKPHPSAQLADHVLGRLGKDEHLLLEEETIPKVIEAVHLWMEQGIEKTMNQFNQK